MATQQAIQGLINNNWQQLSQQKAINNDIAEMDQRRADHLSKLAALGAKSATKLIGDFHQLRMKNLESEAISDWYENQYDFFGQTDEAYEAEGVLKSNAESSTSMHTALGQAREEGVPGNLITKAAEKHPMYGYTLAKLQLGKLGNRYAGHMQSMMAKSQEVLTLPDVVGADGNLHTFKIADAKTLDEKMAAHRYLRGKYFTDHNLGAYGKAFLALPTDRYGSGFLESVQSAESGKDGLFAKYQLESDIYDSQQRISFALATFTETKDPASFQNYLDALAIGLDDKGNRYTPTKMWKEVDKFMIAGIKGNHFNRTDLIKIANTKVPNSESKKHPKGQTYAEKWPQRFGYKKGYGSYMQQWRDSLLKNSRDSHSVKKLTWKDDKKDAIEAIKSAATDAEAGEIRDVLLETYGDHEDFNFADVDVAIHNRNAQPADVPAEIAAIHKQIDGKKRIGGLNISAAAKKDTKIQAALAAEAQREKDVPGYTENLQKAGALIANVQLELGIGGKYAYSYKKPLTTDEQALMKHFEGKFDYYTSDKGGGLSATEAFRRVEEDFIKGGGQHVGLMTQEHVDALKAKGVESNIYSIDINGKLINQESPALSNIYKTPERLEVDTTKYLELNKDGNPLGALSALNDNNEPHYEIPEERTKESADYNTSIWESREVPDHIIDIAKNTNQSIADVLQARLTAWGHGDLDPQIKEMLGTDLIKFLPGGIQNRLFGNDDGFYKPYVIPARIAQANADNPTAVLEQIEPTQQFSSLGEEGEGNIAYASAVAFFGLDMTRDLTTEGAFEWADYIEQAYTDSDFRTQLKEIPEFGYAMYALTGDSTELPLLTPFDTLWDRDQLEEEAPTT